MIAIPSVYNDRPRTFMALVSKYVGEGGVGEVLCLPPSLSMEGNRLFMIRVLLVPRGLSQTTT